MNVYNILTTKLRERKLEFVQIDCLFKVFFGSIDVFIQLEDEYVCCSWIILNEFDEANHIELSDFDFFHSNSPFEDKITEFLEDTFEKTEKYLKLKVNVESQLKNLKEYIEGYDLNLTLKEGLNFSNIIQENYYEI